MSEIWRGNGAMTCYVSETLGLIDSFYSKNKWYQNVQRIFFYATLENTEPNASDFYRCYVPYTREYYVIANIPVFK